MSRRVNPRSARFCCGVQPLFDLAGSGALAGCARNSRIDFSRLKLPRLFPGNQGRNSRFATQVVGGLERNRRAGSVMKSQAHTYSHLLIRPEDSKNHFAVFTRPSRSAVTL